MAVKVLKNAIDYKIDMRLKVWLDCYFAINALFLKIVY